MKDPQHKDDTAHDMPPAMDGDAARADHARHSAHTPSADPAEHAAHDSSYRASELLKPEPDQTAHEMHAEQGKHDAHARHGDHTGHGVMHEGHATMMRNRFFVVLPLTIIVVLYSPMVQAWLGFTMPEFPGSSLIAPILGSFIFFYGGLPFLSMARQELTGRQPGMMTLISVAITAAFLYSVGIFLFPPGETMGMAGVTSMPMMDFFWELATLITVMLLGHWIELRSVGQAQGALRELAKLLPDTAERLLPSGATETVNVSQLQIGDRLLIRPGASIPADGTVAEGESSVNEAMITGESRPVDKKLGDGVIGGTVNESGSLRVTVQQVGEGTALAGIMRLVEDAQKSQSRAQTLAQRAAFYLTIIALAAGALTFIGWLVFTGSLAEAVKNMVTVLVIACPHALGLAVPLVVAISTTLSARNGLLVRQRIALESAKDLNIIIFDKTGTLTKGEQGVVQVAVDGIAEADALRIAAGLEGDSEHMIAEAIRTYVKERGITPASVSRFESIAGRGVKAVVDGVTYSIGGPRLLEQLNLRVPTSLEIAKSNAENAGQSVIYLTNDKAILALFAIADVIREESREAVRKLHDLGLKVAMLTGDSESVARAVAQALNIDTYFAQVLPEHKADKVRELQKGGSKVAMVGDGVNDAPALLTADVGIAIGAGTDVAIESAGIILVRSNPIDIVKIIRLSRATYSKMIQNLVWATGYNIVAIPLAMGVLAPFGITLDPAIGAVFMSVSTIVVAFNAQLLRRLDLAAV
ncbi:MAG: heavy metal translocating P-type ATPase [Anaerolineae bacterium]|nr:heavy metal translocating P-type ATPase [Anaerolineae bacterium]NUQ04901.1 heavy metal translocating P-type ATPase [Anaerolineae bacterium]